MRSFLVSFAIAFAVVFGGLSLQGCGMSSTASLNPLTLNDDSVLLSVESTDLTENPTFAHAREGFTLVPPTASNPVLDAVILQDGLAECIQMFAEIAEYCGETVPAFETCQEGVRVQNGVACVGGTDIVTFHACWACLMLEGPFCECESVPRSPETDRIEVCADFCGVSNPACL